MTEAIDTGDSVLHRPTGEHWVVACVQDGRLSWMGWPEGTASLSDCELIDKATPQRRMYWLQELAKPNGGESDNDHRRRYARHRLSQEAPAAKELDL